MEPMDVDRTVRIRGQFNGFDLSAMRKIYGDNHPLVLEKKAQDRAKARAEAKAAAATPAASSSASHPGQHEPHAGTSQMHESMSPQWESISTTTTSSRAPGVKKPRAKPSTDRMPGHTLLPMSRLESIIYADPDNGTLSKEALFLVAVATEEFLKKFSKAVHTRADVDGRSLVQYRDVAATAFHFEEFEFLQDTIPQPIPLSKALAIVDGMHKEKNTADGGESLSKASISAKEKARERETEGSSISVDITQKAKGKQPARKIIPLPGDSKVNGVAVMPPPPLRVDRPVRERKPRVSSAAGFTPLTERERDGAERPSPEFSAPESVSAGSSVQQDKIPSTGPTRIRIRGPHAGGAPYPVPRTIYGTHGANDSTASKESLNTAWSNLSEGKFADGPSRQVEGSRLAEPKLNKANGTNEALGMDPPLWSTKPLPSYKIPLNLDESRTHNLSSTLAGEAARNDSDLQSRTSLHRSPRLEQLKGLPHKSSAEPTCMATPRNVGAKVKFGIPHVLDSDETNPPKGDMTVIPNGKETVATGVALLPSTSNPGRTIYSKR